MVYPDPNYFDYTASAPPFEEALQQLKEVSQKWFANPSSLHKSGKLAKKVLLELKEEFCDLLNFNDGRLLLCSSGTEANNTILEGHLKKNPEGRILLAENVHDSLWNAKNTHSKQIDILKLDKNGKIDISLLKEKLKQQVSLVCISHVCNETGVIQDVNYISQICSGNGTMLHVDGVQAVGHISVDMNDVQCDYYTFSAHKFGGSRSFGGLMIRDDSFEPLLYGGKQEWGLRAGTENVGGIAAAVTALKMSKSIMPEEQVRLNYLKNYLLNFLKTEIPWVLINNSENGLPGFVSISFPGSLGSEIAESLSLEGYYVSTGSACHENLIEPSRVILALGRSEKEAVGTIRISMGRGTTKKAVAGLGKAICSFVKKQGYGR